jgi:hypothetical protein
MPDGATSTDEVVRFLATVPLLAGVPEAELSDLARALRRREVPAGEVLWRQGEDAGPMLLIVDGRVSVTVRLPGDGTAEVASLGPGEALGELPLVDGGRHSGTARVSAPAGSRTSGRSTRSRCGASSPPGASPVARRAARWSPRGRPRPPCS